MVDKRLRCTRRILADHEGERAMGIDVVGAILRVVSEHEDGSIVPVRTVGNGVDYAAEREIVVGDRGVWSWLAGTRASGVVVGQVEQRELWKFFGGSLRFHKLTEFAEEFVSAELVRVVGIEVRELRSVVVTQRGFGGTHALHLRNRPGPGTRPAPRITDIRGQ